MNDIWKLKQNVVFDNINNPPILKDSVKVNMEKNNLIMFYGEFGWAVGSKTGSGTAHIVHIDETILGGDK